ncbi:hypothetical protein D3C80_1898800 [compost metagenome]
MGLKRVKRVAINATGISVKADMIHQGIGGMAEDQEVKGIAQVTVVIDPIFNDCSLVDKQQIVHE